MLRLVVKIFNKLKENINLYKMYEKHKFRAFQYHYYARKSNLTKIVN